LSVQRTLAACLLAVPVLVSTTAPSWAAAPASATDKHWVDTELKRTGDQRDETNAEVVSIGRKLTQVDAQLPSAQERAARALGVMAAARVRRDSQRKAALSAQREVRGSTVSYQLAQATVESAQQRLDAFVAAAYMGSGAATLTTLANAASLNELANGIATLRYVAEGQDDAVRRLEEARLRAAQRRADLVAKQRLVTAAVIAAEQALQESTQAAAEAQSLQRQISSLIAVRRSALQAAKAYRSAVEARYADLSRRSRQIGEQLSQDAALARRKASVRELPMPIRSTGQLLWPISGPVTSTFGNRLDPVYGVERLHEGIDIAGPRGTPIAAAADGVVVNAGPAGGYGLYTCVAHGLVRSRGLATCYAHQSAVLVAAGQQVKRGQVLGRVGSTGASTGNHVHFEVRLDGTPMDPLGWLQLTR